MIKITELQEKLRQAKKSGYAVLVDPEYSEMPEDFKMEELYINTVDKTEDESITVFNKVGDELYELPNTYCKKKKSLILQT